MSRFLTRRGLIYGAAGTAALGGVAVLGSIPLCNRLQADLGRAAERFRVALPDIHAPERLADWWYAERSDAQLQDALLADPALREARLLSCPASRREKIAATVLKDFRSGSIVVADRIVAARTECLIAAVCIAHA